MNALITGASGFVGSAICEKARQLGWTFISISRRPTPFRHHIQADLTNSLPEGLGTPDLVIHAAARSSPWGSRREFMSQNVKATRNVVDFCEGSGRPHLIYISTSAVLYRNQHQFQMNEHTPPADRFLNHYAETKFLGEEIVRSYTGPCTIVRPRAVFGPRDSVVFPRIIRAARQGRFPIIESNEVVMADLIFIDTLVEYIIRIALRRAEGLYHLSNNDPVAIVSFLKDIFLRLGLQEPKRRISVSKAMAMATLVEATYRALPFLGEPPITRFGVSVFAFSKTMDVSKSLRDLGEPIISVDEGVRRFIDWQKEHM